MRQLAALATEWSDTVPGHVRAALGLPPADGSRFDTVLMGWNTYAAVRTRKAGSGGDLWLFGEGIPLFAGGYRPDAFSLVDSTAYASGVVVNDYQRSRQAR